MNIAQLKEYIKDLPDDMELVWKLPFKSLRIESDLDLIK